MKTNITLITGAYGFIGQHLSESLLQEGLAIRRMTRKKALSPDDIYGDLSDSTSLQLACQGIDTIVHCAGYAHAFNALSSDDAKQHWAINFQGTINLLNAAAASGVKKFIFLSSVKAMPEPGDYMADENLLGKPATPYGESKQAAEQAVFDTGAKTGMHVVILRLTMVYGSGSRGNLERMAHMIKRGLFPPLPETGNHRSMVHVSDVVSAIRTVAGTERSNRQIYIVAGKDAPSGRELFDAIRVACGLSRVRWSIPLFLLQILALGGTQIEKVLKKRLPFDREVLDRLLGSAWYSAQKLEHNLNWQPRVALHAGLKQLLSPP